MFVKIKSYLMKTPKLGALNSVCIDIESTKKCCSWAVLNLFLGDSAGIATNSADQHRPPKDKTQALVD